LMRQAGFIEQAGRGVVGILERWREAGREPPEIVNDPGRKKYGLWLSWQPDRTAAGLASEELLRVGVCSFQDREVETEGWSRVFLPLSVFFQGNLRMAEVDWPEIYRRLTTFLRSAVARRPAIHLDLVVHQSIAFAAGYLVDTTMGIEITLRQRSPRGTEDWRIDEPEMADAPSWEVAEHTLDGDGAEVALAVSSARPILTSVNQYVRANLPAVGRIVEFKPPRGPGLLSVTSGGHAFRLAEAISHEIFRLAAESDRGRRFHLFFAGPNGLLFFLGQLSHIPQTVQLYEYGFDGEGNAAYAPSLSFPPPTS
jgi:SMODS-associated and fused to various effectors sensor domain